MLSTLYSNDSISSTSASREEKIENILEDEKESEEDRNMTRDKQLEEKGKCER
jgi:hypothetical protein